MYCFSIFADEEDKETYRAGETLKFRTLKNFGFDGVGVIIPA